MRAKSVRPPSFICVDPIHRRLIPLLAFAVCLQAQGPPAPIPYSRKAINNISPAELKGDLSFLASDLLAGRYTPSPGLDIAAEFIASKFRAAGLEPGGDNDYFQSAPMITRTLPDLAAPLVFKTGDQTVTVEPAKVHVSKISAAISISDAPVLKVARRDSDVLKGLDLEGKVILAPAFDYSAVPEADRMRVGLAARAFDNAVAASKALIEVVATTADRRSPKSSFLYAEDAAAPPFVFVQSPELVSSLASNAPVTLSIQIPAPEDQKVFVNNVIGVLRGSDPALKSTAVLVTAHYDHIGTAETAGDLAEAKPTGTDKIYNGANDDGSGTVSVIEIARALAHLHPRRSIVFITFFGEERGLLGSTYYGRHPLFPIPKTVADINLEQVGRTDSSEGPEIANASITGYDYSDVTKYLEEAGQVTGITIYKDAAGSDAYFVRSDNAALAEQGVPAHTLTTAFEYPDYHAVGDEWQKVDYQNMAKVDRTVALAVFNIANAAKPPAWNAANPKTERFRQAQERKGRGGTPPN